jgi:hypothetical protein
MDHDDKNESRRNMVESIKYIEGKGNNYAEIVEEINYHQNNLQEYIAELCVKKYNSMSGSNIEKLTGMSMRGTVNKIINEQIAEMFPDINRTRANSAQHLAAHSNVEQQQVCYICGGVCSHPHIEHVIRILLLFLLTSHLVVNHPIKEASLRLSHATCNVVVKGSIKLFDVLVNDRTVRLQAIPVNQTRLSERFETATRTLIPHNNREGYNRTSKNPNTHYVPRPSDANEINLGDPSQNVDAVTHQIEQLFNVQHISPRQVVYNLQEIIDRCVPPLSEIFQRIEKDAIKTMRQRKDKRKRQGEGFKKKTKRIKKIIRRRPTKANKTRNKRT